MRLANDMGKREDTTARGLCVCKERRGWTRVDRQYKHISPCYLSLPVSWLGACCCCDAVTFR